MTKKLFTFILLVSGMFSFTFVNAQSCPGNKIRVYSNKCFSSHSYPVCHSRCVNPNNILNGWSTNCLCGAARLANEPSDGEVFSLAISPNPVSGSSVIYFFLEQPEKASLYIFDVNGRIVSILADKIFEEGENEISWDAADVNAGVYFLRMETAGYSENQKLIVTK